MSQTLPRSEILRGRKNIGLVFRDGRAVSGSSFRCLTLSDPRLNLPAGSTILFGIAVPSRQVRRAVDRNRIKRLVRESYRRHKEILHSKFVAGHHQPVALMFVYTPGAGPLPVYAEVERDVMRILSSIHLKQKPEASR